MPSVLKNGSNVVGGTTIVLGLADIRAKLLSLPGRIGINVVRRGLRAGAVVMQNEARRLVPQPPAKSKKGYSRSGLLKKSIVAESRQVRGKKNVYEAVVTIRAPKKKGDVTDAELTDGPKKGDGPNPRAYAHLVEYGTQPHAVGKGSDIEITRGLGKVFVGLGKQTGAMHPGTSAQPFMRPAFANKKMEAIDAVKVVVRRELEKELAKIAAKGGGRKAG